MALVLITILVVFSLLCPSHREPYLHPQGPLTISQKNYHWKLLDNGTGSIYAPHTYAADVHLTAWFICSRWRFSYLRTWCIRSRCTYTLSVIFSRCRCTYLMHALPMRYLPIYTPHPHPADMAWHHRKHLWMISIIRSCCSSVILLSLGKHSPLRKISAPTSIPEPFM